MVQDKTYYKQGTQYFEKLHSVTSTYWSKRYYFPFHSKAEEEFCKVMVRNYGILQHVVRYFHEENGQLIAGFGEYYFFKSNNAVFGVTHNGVSFLQFPKKVSVKVRLHIIRQIVKHLPDLKVACEAVNYEYEKVCSLLNAHTWMARAEVLDGQ